MPDRQFQKALFVMIIIAGLLGACHIPQGPAMSTLEPGAIYTAAAQTVFAQLTLAAGGTPRPTADSAKFLPTETLIPTNLPTLTDASQAIFGTPEITLTPSDVPDDHITFVKDVTYPDGTDVSPGKTFTKIWRLQNSGPHTWTAGYTLVFDRGDAMGAPASVKFTTEEVKPWEIIDVSVELTAPKATGTYQGYWMLSNESGGLFGCGDSSRAFWVSVDVVIGLDVMFDFNVYADEAVWGTGTMPVDFAKPGTDALAFGPPSNAGDPFVDLRNDQDLENGRIYDWILETYPPVGTDSYLVGKYPSYTVNSEEYLKGKVGLVANSDGSCGSGDVKFQINYTVDDDLSTMKELWNRPETCDGALNDFKIDLSGLVDKEVQFYLLVIANTLSAENYAIWDSLTVQD